MNKFLLSLNSPIIIGVSGGADSLCLLGSLHEAGYSLIVAHFDHQLRSDSAEGTKFVAEIAAKYNLPFVSKSGDVVAYAKAEKQTIEEAARNLRYRFLFDQARQQNAQAVAVGHTADDQAETILMHFLRGAGLSGLKGIEPRIILPNFDLKIPLIRPILDLWRVETEAYCAAHNLTPHEDPSNASDDFFRNRLRHNLIPELEKYNPQIRATLLRTSRALQGDHAILSELISETWESILFEETQIFISFHLSSFSKLSIPLIRNLIRYAVGRLRRGQVDISFSTLENAAQFIFSPDSAQRTDLAFGLILLKEGDTLYLTSDLTKLPLGNFPQLSVTANRSCEAVSPTAKEIASAIKLPRNDNELFCEINLGDGWILTAKSLSSAPKLKNGDPFQVTLDAALLGENLTLRTRRAGERFRPLGMNGKSMKLKEFFINVKLSYRARDKYPLLCADDEIAWIPGYQPSHSFRVTEKTQGVVVFTLKKM